MVLSSSLKPKWISIVASSVIIFILIDHCINKKEKNSASVTLHAMLSCWPPSQRLCLLRCLRQVWSKPSTSESPHRRIGGNLLSRGDVHSVWLRDLANIVVSRGHSRWCPACVESEQALLNTNKVTRQQCNVSFGWQPTNDLTSPPVDLWGRGRDTEWILVMMMMKWCLMSSDVGWHIRDKLWPMPNHGSINLYIHGSQKAR